MTSTEITDDWNFSKWFLQPSNISFNFPNSAHSEKSSRDLKS